MPTSSAAQRSEKGGKKDILVCAVFFANRNDPERKMDRRVLKIDTWRLVPKYLCLDSYFGIEDGRPDSPLTLHSFPVLLLYVAATGRLYLDSITLKI